jgi:hypothetical protein
MKYLFYFSVLTLLLTSCAHKIVRTGYEINKSEYKNCSVVVQKNIIVSDTVAEKVGEIKLRDSGFSTSCNEKDAILALKNEACAIGSDLIVIINEKRGDVVSDCYRCKAIFYRYKQKNDKNMLSKNDDTKPEEEGVAKKKSGNVGRIIVSTIVGLFIGFLITTKI